MGSIDGCPGRSTPARQLRTPATGRSRSCPISNQRATSPRLSPSSPKGSAGAIASRRCSASPGRARVRPSRGPSNRCRSPRSSSRPISRWPRSWPTSCASSSRTTGLSTSCPTTTTTSPRPTWPRPTRTSKRTARSTTRSTGCATPRRRRSSRDATPSSLHRCRVSTGSVRRSSTRVSCWCSTRARSAISAPSSASWSTCSTSATT